MSLITNLAIGFEAALTPEALLYSFIGVSLGMLAGTLPGVGIMAAISMLMPLTFYLDPLPGLVMLAGIYYGATYGGSTAAILLNMPGTPNTAVTCLDGYPMAQQGRAGVALFMTTIASFVGSIVGIVLLASFAPWLAQFALKFATQEYFSLMVLGLVAGSLMASGSPLKSLSMVVLGLILGLVGRDLTSGVSRFTFGVTQFQDGLPLVAVALGLFGMTELMRNAGTDVRPTVSVKDITRKSLRPTPTDWRRSIMPMARGAGIGSIFGALPGTGGMIAAFMSYAVEKRVSRRPEEFGKGAIEGIAGPETANNAAVMTTLVPTLSMGIPGDPISALLLAVMLIHGLNPGPEVISGDPHLFWGLIVSFFIGNLLLLLLNIPFIGLWVRILTIPYQLLFPCIVGFLCIGVYSVSMSVVDIFTMVGFGLAGLCMLHLRLPAAPLILGLVLGPLLEENFRRSLLVSRGDFLTFIERPISGTFAVLAVLLVVRMVVSGLRDKWQRRPNLGQ
jgi:putative tricarboxylic transport membrane protein